MARKQPRARRSESNRTQSQARAPDPPEPASRAERRELWQRLGWWAAAAVWAFVAASLFSYSAADAPGHAVFPHNSPAANWCGPVGAVISHYTLVALGAVATWALVAAAAGAIIATAGRGSIDQPILRAIGVLLFALALSGFHALLAPGLTGAPQGAGGLVAIAGVAELTQRFSVFGSALWLSLFALVGAALAFDKWLLRLPGVARAVAVIAGAAGGRAFGALAKRSAAAREARRVRANDLDDDERVERPAKGREKRREAPPIAIEPKAAATAAPVRQAPIAEELADDDEDAAPEAPEAPGAPQVFDPEALRQKISRLPVRFAGSSTRTATEADLRDIQCHVDLEGYQFPPLDLLEDPEHNFTDKLESFVRDQAKCLEEALRVYRIDGEVVSIDSGPVITLYEVKLAPGTKVAQLQNVASDLARAMKAVNIRIVPNTQGRDTVGVEVPNAEKEKVRLKELMSHARSGEAAVGRMRLPMFLGKDAHGDPLIEDLASMPHCLIAGTTGSGKSVCINTIIMSFLYTKKPNELKLVLIDPKMVEMSQFRDIPHLMCPVVTEMSKACAILEWAVNKMDERYELLAEAGCRDINAYNDLPWEDLRERFNPQSEAEAARIPRKLPFIVFIIDELADLMMTQKEVESSIVRIAQKARAVGIHLVLATQRPQANVVTGLIKSNMPARISFKVASGMDSRIVLDQKGGELLLGQGDMLFLSPRSHKLIRAQGTLVEDRETRKVVRFLKEIAAPSFERSLIQLRGGDSAEMGDDAVERSLENAQQDPLFDKAVEIILESKRGSVSLLQRRLAIGYTRASRLIDLMGHAGILGDHKGTVAREVVITPEEWEAMKEQAAADAAAAEALAPGTPGTAAPRPPAETLFDDDAPAPAAATSLRIAIGSAAAEPAAWKGTDDHEEEEEEDEDEDSDESAEEEEEEEEEEDFEAEDDEEYEEEEDGEEEEEEEEEGEEDGEWEYEEDEGEEEEEEGEGEGEEEEDDGEYEDDEDEEEEEEDEEVAQGSGKESEGVALPFKPNRPARA